MKKITSNPKLSYSAPILSLHCTLMSISIPRVGLREIPCMAAVGTMAQAQLETVSDCAGRKPQLSPSHPLHQPSQPPAESHKPSTFLSYGIPARVLHRTHTSAPRSHRLPRSGKVDLELGSCSLDTEPSTDPT